MVEILHDLSMQYLSIGKETRISCTNKCKREYAYLYTYIYICVYAYKYNAQTHADYAARISSVLAYKVMQDLWPSCLMVLWRPLFCTCYGRRISRSAADINRAQYYWALWSKDWIEDIDELELSCHDMET